MSIPHSTPPPDSSWQPRTVSASADVERYSKFVGYMRIGLPAIAGVLVVLVIALPQFMGEDERFRISTAPIKEAAVEALSMVNARYFGTDKKGQPFSVTAEGVKERDGNDAQVELKAPQADITLTNGDWLSIEATAGLYDRTAETLDLNGSVTLFQDNGFEMQTEALTIKLKDGSAQSRTPVQSQGPFGELNAQGFDLFDKGERVVFLGPARLTLNDTFKSATASPAATTTTKQSPDKQQPKP